jgi:hypothetical protein
MKFGRNQPRSQPIVRVARLAGPELVALPSWASGSIRAKIYGKDQVSTALTVKTSVIAADQTQARPPGAIHPRPVEHARGDHRQESRFQIHWRRVGRHHDIARALDADRARRAGGVRARSYPRAHRRRPRAGRGARAENGPTAQTNAAPEAAIRRRDTGDETLADIGRSYNVSPATISRLMA